MTDLAKEDFNQRNFNQATNKKKKNLSQYVIRLEEEDYNLLKGYFHHKGLSLSSGMRMVLKDYLHKNGISQ